MVGHQLQSFSLLSLIGIQRIVSGRDTANAVIEDSANGLNRHAETTT